MSNATLSLNGTNASGCGEAVGGAPSDFALGVIAALVGSSVLAFGMAGQRYAHVKITTKNPGAPYVCEPLWIVMFALFIVGNFGDAIALSFAPQSVVTPLGSMSLVWNVVVARLLLGERLGLLSGVGCLAVIAGVVLIVIPSVMDPPCTEEDVTTLVARWAQPAFIAWTVCQVSLLGLTVAHVLRLERRMAARYSATQPAAAVAVAPAEGDASTCDRLKRLKRLLPASYAGPAALATLTARERSQLRMGYVLACGLLASWTVLFVKCFGELSKGAARFPELYAGGGAFTDARTYGLVGGLVLSVPGQLTFLNKSLQRFEAQFVVPTLQAFWSLSSIIQGALFFREFDRYAPWHFGVFAAGVVLSLVGIVLLSMRHTMGEPVGQPKHSSAAQHAAAVAAAPPAPPPTHQWSEAAASASARPLATLPLPPSSPLTLTASTPLPPITSTRGAT